MNPANDSSFRQNAVQQRLILEAAKDYAIFTTDLDRRITSWNAGAERLFGYAEAEVMGQPVDGLFVPEDRTPTDGGLTEPEREVNKTLREGRAENERWHLRHDGTRVYGSGVLSPLRDDTGTIVGLLNVVRDLTRQKRAEEDLRESEEKFRTLFDLMGEGFALCEGIRNETGTLVDYQVTLLNPAFERLTGLKRADWQGKRVLEIAPGMENHWFEAFQQVLDTGQTVTFEKYLPYFARWYAVTAFHYTNETFAYLYTDVTERKQVEANLVFLGELSQELGALTNIEETMNALGAKIGGHFSASVCVFSDIDEAAGTYTNPFFWQRAGEPSLLGTFNIGDYHNEGVRQAMRAGETYFVSDTADDPRTNGANMGALECTSFVTVPLLRDGEWLFNLTIVDTVPRDWRTDEIGLMRELTSRIWTRLERARAEENLRQSEEKFRTLFDSMDEGVSTFEVIFDEQGKAANVLYLENNPAVEKTLGTELTVGKTAREVIPGIEKYWMDAVGNVVRTGEPLRTEYAIKELDRQISAYFVRVGNPDNCRIIAVYNDITDRKRAERHQAFLLKFSDTLRTQPNADAIANVALQRLAEQLQIDRCYIGVYRLAEDRGEFTHQVGNDRVPPVPDSVRLSDFPDALRIAFDRTLVIDDVGKAAGLTDMDRQNLGALGFSALVASTLRHGESNPLWSIVAVVAQPRHWTPDEIKLIEEVTERTWTAIERVRAEESLAESQRFVQGIITSLPLVIYIFDLVERKNLYISPQVGEVFGYTPADMQTVGSDLLPTYFHPDDLPRIAAYFEQINGSTGEAVFSIECRMHHQQRGWMWVICRDTVYARDANGRPTQLLGTAEDISERKGAEVALLLADQRKNEFLALLAHELRNPLATLSNTLLILSLTNGQTDDLNVPEATAMMTREVAQLTRLVDDLLDVSRISRGNLTLTFARLDLTELVGQAVEAVRAQFDMADRWLSVLLPPQPTYLTGDAARLRQVVSNLLTNALKFTNSGGHITVSLARVGNQAVLRVQDDGIGIPPHELTRIFEMFAQVDVSLGRSQGGLGLGLTLVNELVNLHKGRVTAQSAGAGIGSTFTVYLPVEPTPEPVQTTADMEKPAPSASAPKRRVLVVDDNRDAATTLAMLLKLTGNEVHTRHDGQLGIDAAESLRPQAVILDISMPGLDGYQVCQLIRAQPWGQTMTLIALSGYGQEKDKQRSREAGFDAHLVKPVDMAALTALLAGGRGV